MKSLRNKLAILMLCFSLLLPTLASAHSVSTTGPAQDLRTGLGQLLGEHALLAIVAMQKGYDGKPDFADAAAALGKNTDDLAAAIAKVYGQSAGDAFKPIWASHIGYFVDYVKATAANDENGRQKAVANLDDYRMKQAEFFNKANPAYFDKTAIADGLKVHVNHLLDAFNHYVKKDYDQAYADTRTAYAHMFMTGDTLSGGIAAQFPDKFSAATAKSAGVDLRAGLGQLLGEHASLAVIAMQKGIDGAPDFNAAAAALGKNTDDLSAAIASVYGQPAGDAFKPIWASHIAYFVDYVKATAASDENGRQKAVANLDDYRMKQAEFFNKANPANFDKNVIADGLKVHVNHLLDAFNSYVKKDYMKAYMDERTAYTHMFATANDLAAGIVAQFPDKFHGPNAIPAVPSVWMKIGSSELKVNGATTQMDVSPFMKDGNTFIPLRYFGEAIGAKVTWDAAAQSAQVQMDGNTAVFWIGRPYMELNGQRKDVGTPIFLEGGRTQVPLLFITELLGWDVKWNDADGSITLTKAMPAAAGHTH